MNFLTNVRVFLDESAFDINMKRSRAWSNKGTRIIVTQAYYEGKYNVYLSAISASGLITAGATVGWYRFDNCLLER
ncbi:hypothetical protein RO3G_15044 [Rhizopus delemar RA 99-880]|uniref:Tc1-like transposase DDE domain-containing protein n=1 Tax=Rhizopus delemar (strain RA 99-880 / ATCC MYA-4621 / FGSC 9543 / NRRL 43880) TaxID=246409 RepID=I1CPF3_RHIO9|nr:hypothetical protein RO3G_15044 [Rhizopus delemar RA 99-880]|eukprot:EIE90333.1 hypothetical protein RO3G_15044 [Rhizopus delemar RA 99-880]